MGVVPILLQLPIALLGIIPDEYNNALTEVLVEYMFYPGVTLISFIILFLFKENKDLRKVFSLKNNKILYGLLIGFGLNAISVLLAYLFGYLKLAYSGFNIGLLLISFISVTIQSASEEVICRGYLMEKILKDYKSPLLAIMLNSLIFALFHIFNDGASIFSTYSIFVIGILFSLFAYYNGNIWESVAIHTMWNFTQNFIFGLPNSGYPAIYSIFKITEAKNGFAYNTVFGVESTITVLLLDILVIVIIQLLHKKNQS
jgi:membrane protease YdiL (CAAX protease family)